MYKACRSNFGDLLLYVPVSFISLNIDRKKVRGPTIKNNKIKTIHKILIEYGASYNHGP